MSLDCLARSRDVAGHLRRKIAWQAEQVPCGASPADTGNRRPGAEEEGRGVSIQHRLTRGHHRQRVKSAPRELEGKIATGQPLGARSLEGQEAPRVGFNLRTGEATLWRTDAELPQSCSKGCARRLSVILGGSRRAKRRRTLQSPDLCYKTFRHNFSISHNRARPANVSALSERAAVTSQAARQQHPSLDHRQ